MYVILVNGHLLCTLFSTSLARNHGNSISQNFHDEGQTHQHPLWHRGAFFLLLVDMIGMAHELTYNMVYAYMCVNLWEAHVCMFVSSTSVIIFNPSAGAIIDQWSLPISEEQRPVFYVPALWKTPATLKLVLIWMNELNKPGERVHDRN